MMTVAELMRALSVLDPSMPVLVDGYEAGMDEPVLSTVKAARAAGPDAAPYYGTYAEPDEWTCTTGDPFVAVKIGRQ